MVTGDRPTPLPLKGEMPIFNKIIITMRIRLGCLSILFFTLTTSAQQLNLIPMPADVKYVNEVYPLKKTVTVSSDLPAQGWISLFNYFKAEMKKQFNITVTEIKS